MTAKAAFTNIPFRDSGTAGEVCRAVLDQYDTMEHLVSHRDVKDRDGITKTLEQRFEDIYFILMQYEGQIACMFDADSHIISFPSEELPEFEQFLAHESPQKTSANNAIRIVFKDGTSVHVGVGHGITKGKDSKPEAIKKLIQDNLVADAESEADASSELPVSERHI